jgi:hypothetical protein
MEGHCGYECLPGHICTPQDQTLASSVSFCQRLFLSPLFLFSYILCFLLLFPP